MQYQNLLKLAEDLIWLEAKEVKPLVFAAYPKLNLVYKPEGLTEYRHLIFQMKHLSNLEFLVNYFQETGIKQLEYTDVDKVVRVYYKKLSQAQKQMLLFSELSSGSKNKSYFATTEEHLRRFLPRITRTFLAAYPNITVQSLKSQLKRTESQLQIGLGNSLDALVFIANRYPAEQ